MAKVLVSMDDRLLKRLDDEAHRRGLTRSRLVSDMAEKELGGALGPGADPKVHEAMEDLRRLAASATYADNRDSTVIIREMRDSR